MHNIKQHLIKVGPTPYHGVSIGTCEGCSFPLMQDHKFKFFKHIQAAEFSKQKTLILQRKKKDQSTIL